jgi:hypothetical protein
LTGVIPDSCRLLHPYPTHQLPTLTLTHQITF